MAHIYPRDGAKGRIWYFRYFDEHGRRVKKAGFSDKRATEQLAAKLEAEAARIRSGLETRAEVESKRHAARPLEEHLAAYATAKESEGASEQHRGESLARVRKVLGLAGAERLDDLAEESLVAAIVAASKGRSLRTRNAYLANVRAFVRWAVRVRRLRSNPLEHVRSWNEELDEPTRTRRALAADECLRLFAAAESAPPARVFRGPHKGRRPASGEVSLSGPDRAMLYRVALGTGFRVGELASLTPEAFDLDGSPPTVTCRAAASKRRRVDVQPIRADLAERLRAWLAGKPAGEPLWRLPARVARMLRADLGRAGIPYETAEGVADFHALRHTYITFIVASTDNVKVAQTLARHSTPVLTIGRYAKARIHDQLGALEGLPGEPAPKRARKVK